MDWTLINDGVYIEIFHFQGRVEDLCGYIPFIKANSCMKSFKLDFTSIQSFICYKVS